MFACNFASGWASAASDWADEIAVGVSECRNEETWGLLTGISAPDTLNMDLKKQ